MGCPMSRRFCETWEQAPTIWATRRRSQPHYCASEFNQRARDSEPQRGYYPLAARAEPFLGFIRIVTSGFRYSVHLIEPCGSNLTILGSPVLI
jgi:hypothetical protein